MPYELVEEHDDYTEHKAQGDPAQGEVEAAREELSDEDREALEEEQERERLEREEHLQILGNKLQRLAHEQVAARNQIEDRWLCDFRQYHGEYTPDEIARMKRNNSSQIYVGITRNKTRAAIARLSDMLLPNDERNFGLSPTPDPATSKVSSSQPMQADKQGAAMQQGAQGQPSQAEDDRERAEQAAEKMQEQIDDDFTEAHYTAHTRDVIEDACILGTGILKGPTVVNRTRRAWTTDPKSGRSVIEIQEEYRAGLERVDPWDAFPDMSARTPEEAEFWFERKLLNRKQLRDLADLPGVMHNQLRRALEDSGGQFIAQDRRDELRAITGVDTVADDKRWEMWEYWGPLDKEDLKACGCDVDDDPLVEYTGCVLMVGRYVIKAAINPLESGELPYSAFNWEGDESSIFGFGVPYLLRHSQKVINAAWRMMMDNASVSAGPQIVYNKRAVQPADGRSWDIYAMKAWEATGEVPVNQAFSVHHIQSNQAELANIFQMAQQLADTETNLPVLLQGEGVSGGPGSQTLGGMQMLMNNSNIVLRSAVKNFDDGITIPTVRRFYDFHMMYTDRPEIKGDFDIDARGTSVLIAREEQQEKLMMLSQVASSNEAFAKRTDWGGLYKEILKTLQVPVENITHSDEKVREAQQNQEVPPEQQEKRKELELKERELDLKEREQKFQEKYKAAELKMKREREQMELALKENLSLADLQGRLGIRERELDLREWEVTRKSQDDRDKAAAQFADSQNERMARRENQDMGYDSYG